MNESKKEFLRRKLNVRLERFAGKELCIDDVVEMIIVAMEVASEVQ